MYERYINFDDAVRKILMNREDDLVALHNLTEQYAELLEDDGVNAIQYDGDAVQSSPSADGVINKAIQRQIVNRRRVELETERRVFDRAWKQLTKEERQILETFFTRGMSKRDAIDILCESLNCEVATVYRKKDAAFRRFKKLIFG